MTTVYLIRHGEAEGNVYRRCQGQYDSMLTPRGEKQIEKLADRFDSVSLDQIYASDLYRAYCTAKAIAVRKGMSVEMRPGMREIGMGDWEDKPWAELEHRFSRQFRIWMEEPWNFDKPDSESVLQAGQRAYDCLQEIAAENPEKTIAVVTHGSVIRGILGLTLEIPAQELPKIGWGDNTCVAKLLFSGSKIQVEYKNDASHLPDDLSTMKVVKWVEKDASRENYQMWFRPIDWSKDSERILAFVRMTGKEMTAEEEQAYLKQTRLQVLQNPRAACIGMVENLPMAFLRLDVLEESDPNTGVIDTMSLMPEYQGKGYGPQMLGECVSVYREMGKQTLSAKVPETDERTLSFLYKNGFTACGNTNGRVQVEKSIQLWK